MIYYNSSGFFYLVIEDKYLFFYSLVFLKLQKVYLDIFVKLDGF